MRVLPFMKCVARAVLGEGVEKLAKLAAEFVPFGGYALEFVAGVAKRTVEEMRREHVQPRVAVEAQAALPDADARASAEAVVIEVAPQLPAPQRKQLVEYLSQLPHTLRATLKRPEDPEGKTVPADWDFADPRTLAQALPVGLPRFSPGDDAPEPGWKLVRLLGRGGMGEVWLGQHPVYKNLVAAFKFCLDPAAQKSLLDHEGVLVDRLTGLSMPGVVTMLGADPHAAAPWLKYQYVPHGDLTQLLHRWKDDAPEKRTAKLLKLWYRLAVIVGRLHDLDDPIVHRDLKPANVLVRWHDKANDYELYVADFGIGTVTARRSIEETQRRPDATASLGLLRGSCTPVYASPQQQAGGKAAVADDLFSLGVIGYQLLMGRFDKRIPTGKAWKVALTRLHVPASVVDLIEACCEDEPADRPAGATALAEAIRAALSTPAVTAEPGVKREPERQPPPPSPAERVRRLRGEAAKLHEDARALLEMHDYEEASRLLQGFRPELIPMRDAALLADTAGKRDALRGLHAKIQTALDGNLTDPRLPMWLGAYLAIKPNDPEKIDLAREFPPPKAGSVLTNGLGMKFAYVPAGSFWMGGGGGKPGEKLVEIANSFYMGIHPVTQGDWQAVMGNNPSYFSRSGGGKDKVTGLSDADLKRLPVEQVNCDDVQQFIDRLSQKYPLDGHLYRLPAEAEWEYSCRNGAGSKDTSAFSFYFDRPTNDLSVSQANFNCQLGRTSQVGLHKPNALGIYDLHGNVWEWCLDAEGSSRVNRGGGWGNAAGGCSAGFRSSCVPAGRNGDLGFRLLLSSASS